MRKVILLLALAIFLVPALSFAQDKHIFRKTRWGMSKEEVKQSEGRKPDYEEEMVLGYSEKIAGMDVVLFYYFSDGKLYQAAYVDVEKYTFENKYIDDYKTFKKLLTEKYGDPILDKQTWYSDLYKDDPSKWGFAISMGQMEYITSWRAGRTTITLELIGENYKIHFIYYVYRGRNKQGSNRGKREKGFRKTLMFEIPIFLSNRRCS